MSNVYDGLIKRYAGECGFTGKEWLRLKSQVKAESAFDPRAVSSVGAKGLAQFMPATWEWAKELGWVAKDADVFDPEQNIKAQAHYMRWLLDRLPTWEAAFAAYNWGIGNMRKAMVDPEWKKKLPAETKGYLERIQRYYDEYTDNGVRYVR